MTRKELTERLSDGEQANLAIDILLENIKPAFLISAIKTKRSEIENRIKAAELEGWVRRINGMYAVNWFKAENLRSLHMTEDEKQAYTDASEKCRAADCLLYSYNRVNSLLTDI